MVALTKLQEAMSPTPWDCTQDFGNGTRMDICDDLIFVLQETIRDLQSQVAELERSSSK